MAGKRCCAFSCWALALLSFASFTILYQAPWQKRLGHKELDEKRKADDKHIGRKIENNDVMVNSVAGTDLEEDYDDELDEQARKKTGERSGGKSEEEKRARRLRRLAEDQAEYKQWVSKRRKEKRRGGKKGRGGRKEMRRGEKLKTRDFELWKDLLSIDEEWAESKK